jgi:hypothetical protein
MSEEAKYRYLEMIQGVINRLSGNAFLLKGWAISVVAALLGISEKLGVEHPLVFSITIISIFWILDGYYLYLEKCYRDLFENARQSDFKDIDFNMTIPNKCRGLKKLLAAIFSLPNILLFSTLIIVSIIVVGGACGS